MNTKWNTKVQRFRLMSLTINHEISWRNTLNCFVEDDEKDKRFVDEIRMTMIQH